MTYLALHKIELASPETWTVMSLLAGTTAISQIQSLRWLVSAGDLGKLTLIPYSIGSELLPRNMGQGGSTAFSHPLHRLGGVFFAERTVSVKLLWHLHFVSSLNLHFKR